MFRPDNPIESVKKDTLGRSHFAHSIAKTICDWQGEDSFVIGLYGAWGSGKSSIKNIAIEHILSDAIPTEKRPLVLEFNPWQFTEQDKLSSAFFDQLATELSYKDKSVQVKRLADQLRAYGKFLETLQYFSNLMPYLLTFFLLIMGLFVLGLSFLSNLKILIQVGRVLGVIFTISGLFLLSFKKVALAASSFLSEYSRITYKTLSQIKNDLANLIKNQGRKILVIIDDIDRLNQKEIKQVFQLIKLNADFPRTIYLVLFDPGVVEKCLNEQPGISGKDYLKKIVQVSFDVPEVSEGKIINILLKEIDLIIKDLPDKYWDNTRWGNLFHAGFKQFFKSLRDVKRYLNSLEVNMSLLKKRGSIEVNPVDFIGIETIRVFVPEAYEMLRENKFLFTEVDSLYLDTTGWGANKRKKRNEEIQSLFNRIPEATCELTKKIIFELFPQVEGLFNNTTYSTVSMRGWNRTLRICSKDIFDRYFVLDNPEGDIPQFEIESVLASTGNREQFLGELQRLNEEKRLRKFLERFEDFVKDIDVTNMVNVITSLYNIEDTIPEDEKIDPLDIGTDMQIMRIVYQMLKEVKNEVQIGEMLITAIKNTNGLYIPIQQISLELQSHEEKGNKEDSLLINKEDLERLKALCVEKVKERRHKNTLEDNRHLVYILYRWKEWGDHKELEEFVKEITANEKGLVKFLSKFLFKQTSHTSGDYVYIEEWKLSLKNFSEFINPKEAEKKIKSLDTKKLEGKERTAVELFLRDVNTSFN
jgi:predicted KAP-like P-loop ATPase